MPFKSDKQRKWMWANDPEMAKKWEKEEAIRGKLRNVIRQEIKSINEGWWEDLSDKAQAAYIKKHGAAPNSSGKKEDEMGDHIRKGIAKDKKGRAKMKKLNRDYDAKTSTASDIAKDMGGNMTGAVKKIEKIKKGLSDDPKVKAALRKANESVNEARLVGYDKSYLDNAKKRLKVPHEITKIEYKRTPLRSGVQDKFVRIWFKHKWKPGIRFDPEEHWVSVFYDSPERLKMIGKTLKLKLKESVNESDLGLTYKKGKTVKVTHKKSGKELVIIDKPNVKREYEKIGYFAEGTVNELQMAPFSSQEARSHINSDIKDMSKLLGKTSQKVIKIMMDGVKGGKYTAMDISRGIKEGPAQRTHFGEMTFIQSLWTKMRDKFRRYSKDRKLS